MPVPVSALLRVLCRPVAYKTFSRTALFSEPSRHLAELMTKAGQPAYFYPDPLKARLDLWRDVWEQGRSAAAANFIDVPQ
jgi:hypothetical protein